MYYSHPECFETVSNAQLQTSRVVEHPYQYASCCSLSACMTLCGDVDDGKDCVAVDFDVDADA